MKLEFVPVGRIVGVHGIRGELKVLPLEGEADFLAGFRTFYLEGHSVAAESCRVHKGMALLKLEGVEDRTAAEGLRGKELLVRRADARLPEGAYFDAELIGLDVCDGETGRRLGELTKVERYPASKVYTVRGEKEFLIPAVKDAFILGVDLERGRMDIRMWEGLTE